MFEISNPRKEDTIENWPHGGNRVTATFTLNSNNRGERISRVTTGKPKRSTYYRSIRLVDGSDGKTHMIADTGGYADTRHLTILSCNMQHQDFTVFPDDDRYAEFKEMAWIDSDRR